MSFRRGSIFAIAKATLTPEQTVTPTSTVKSVGLLPRPEKIVSATMLELSAKILISALIMLVVLSIGIYLRRRLVHYLKKSVLDRWITETLGIVLILVPLTIGGIIALSVWRNLASFFEELSKEHGIDVYQISEQLLATILLIALGIGIARTIESLTLRGLSERHIDINLRTLISRICYFIVLLTIGFWALSIWNIPLGIPATAIGIITVLVSFAVQDILKDLVAGFYLLVERPFFIGDQISVTVTPAIYVGKVQDIRLRATRLRLIGGEEITIPNALLFGSSVINNTTYGERRAAITIVLAEVDFSPDKTAERIQKALAEIPTIMPKPEPVVSYSKYAEEKVTLLVRFWIASSETIDVSEAMHMLHKLMPTAELTVVEPSGAA
jgi:small-conductance mechanosensitive channel